MKRYQPRHRLAHNLLHYHFKACSNLKQNIAELGRHRANERKRILLIIVIPAHIALKKPDKLIEYEIMHIFIVKVVGKEERIGAEIAVGISIIIHSVHHIIDGDLEFFQEIIHKAAWGNPLHCIAEKQTSQRCTTAFIAEYEAQRTHILGYFLAIVEA